MTRNPCQRSSKVQFQSTHALPGPPWSLRSAHTPVVSPDCRNSAGHLASQLTTGTRLSRSSGTSSGGNANLQHLRSHQVSMVLQAWTPRQSTRRRLRCLPQQQLQDLLKVPIQHLCQIAAPSFRTTYSRTSGGHLRLRVPSLLHRSPGANHKKQETSKIQRLNRAGNSRKIQPPSSIILYQYVHC